MNKFISNLSVCLNQKISRDFFILGLKDYKPLPAMLPGQFVEVKVENNADVFLRRPISIHDVDYSQNILYLLIRIVGKGTQTLSLLKEGEMVNIVYPLGNSFNTQGVKNVLLAGGGCGTAPMLFLARYLSELKIETTILIGGKTSDDVLRVSDFRNYGKVFISTDDGSMGDKGFLTENPVMKNIKSFDRIYTCGPVLMMKIIANIAQRAGVDCEVSLENNMACGIGACLCCVTETVEGHKCVCTDGPVFNVKQLTWQI
jgi:dihydroorotate dehydrogenase electron transfer subunit